MATAIKEPKKPKAKPPAIEVPPKPEGLACICQRAELLAAVEFVAAAVKPKSPKQCLLGIHITASENKLTLRATDLECGLSTVVSAVQIEGIGVAVLPAVPLREMLRKLNDDTVRLTAGADKAKISGKQTHYDLNTFKAEEFPPEVPAAEMVSWKIPLAKFKHMLALVSPSISDITDQYKLQGILLEFKAGILTVAATDARRLSIDFVEAKGAADALAIVPQSAVGHVLRLEGGEEDEIELGISPSMVTFSCNDTRIVATQIEGHFPPYDDIIPKDASRTVKIGRDALLDAIGQATVMLQEQEGSKAARFSIADKSMVLSCRSIELGASRVPVDCKCEGEPIEIGLNPLYVADAVREAGEIITIGINAPHQAIKISDGTNYVCVIMPVNIVN